MDIELSKGYIEGIYYKALNQHLRKSDLVSVEKLMNTFINDIINKNKNINLDDLFKEQRSEQRDNFINESNIVLHNRKTDQDYVFSDSRGWCWSCSKVRQINDLKNILAQYEQKVS